MNLILGYYSTSKVPGIEVWQLKCINRVMQVNAGPDASWVIVDYVLVSTVKYFIMIIKWSNLAFMAMGLLQEINIVFKVDIPYIYGIGAGRPLVAIQLKNI